MEKGRYEYHCKKCGALLRWYDKYGGGMSTCQHSIEDWMADFWGENTKQECIVALERELAECKEKLTAYIQAVGLASTIVPDMIVDVEDPIGMMQKVVATLAERRAKTLTKGEDKAVEEMEPT